MKKTDETKTLLTVFKKEVNYLILLGAKKSNVVIGGYCALEQHGIELQRKPEDIDILIFKPTQEQIAYVQGVFEKDFGYLPRDPIPTDKVRSWKIVKKELNNYETPIKKVLNVVLLDGWDIPDDSLWMIHESKCYKINSVRNIVFAKKTYQRMKDAEDLCELKNRNFNFTNLY